MPASVSENLCKTSISWSSSVTSRLFAVALEIQLSTSAVVNYFLVVGCVCPVNTHTFDDHPYYRKTMGV